MATLHWEGTRIKGNKSKTRRGADETLRGRWTVDDIFMKLIKQANRDMFVKSELIVDWISRAKPKKSDVKQV